MKHYILYPKQRKLHQRVFKYVLLLLTLSLTISGMLLTWPWVNALLLPANPPDAKSTVTTSTDNPDERHIKVSPNGYQVAADQPRLLSFPSLDESSYIQRVGIDQKDRVAVPNNVNLAGWYINSAKPGHQGLSIIDGHVAGHYKSGVFGRLAKLKVGDSIIVEFDDKTQRNFNVTKIQTVAEDKANTVLFEQLPDIKAQLNLITCATYIAHTKSYADRLIVTAKLAEH